VNKDTNSNGIVDGQDLLAAPNWVSGVNQGGWANGLNEDGNTNGMTP
jgi:hypothetical protein